MDVLALILVFMALVLVMWLATLHLRHLKDFRRLLDMLEMDLSPTEPDPCDLWADDTHGEITFETMRARKDRDGA